MSVIAFYIAAVIAVLTTLLVITRKNAVQALLYLAVSLISVAVIFYDLGAPFMAALEVIVYAGSIIVLFIFVVMMLNLGERATAAEATLLRPRMWIGPTILAAILLAEIAYLLARGNTAASAAHVIPPREVGLALYGPYLLGVELSSMLLMGALVGAYHLGWHKQPKPETQDVHREHATSPDAGRGPVRTGSGRTVGAA
ncbi:MAG TPA: NADH-quinone oxidoreductase subunit J [Terriglobales bacterium]